MGQLKLATSFMRKRKASTIILVVIFLIAALLINACIVSFVNMQTLFDRTKEKTNEADLIAGFRDVVDIDLDRISKLEHVEKIEKEEVIGLNGKINARDKKVSATIFISNLDTEREIAKPKIIEEVEVNTDDAVYLPIGFKINYGYESNDKFIISLGNLKKEFTIAGFYESTMWGSPMMGGARVFVKDSVYKSDFSILNPIDVKLVLCQTDKDADTNAILKEITNLVDDSLVVFAIGYKDVKMGSSVMSSSIILILMIFGIFIFLISILILRFQIKNFIEEDIKDIGVLKANGYTGKQLFRVLILQYFILALIGTFVGVCLSYAFIPIIGSVISKGIGLYSSLSFNVVYPLLVMLILIVLTIGIVALIAKRIKKITPVTALRSGIETHSFKKNRFPLENKKGNIVGTLSLKSIFNNIKQNILLFIIVIILTFSSFTCLILYDNMVTRKDAMYDIGGMENADITMLYVPKDENNDDVRAFIEKQEEVKKTVGYKTCVISGYSIYMIDEVEELNIQPIIKGRWAKHENEIVVSPIVGVEVGETYTLKTKDKSVDYIVTGICQGVMNLGRMMYMTKAGGERLDAKPAQALYLYLNNYEEDLDALTDTINKKFKEEVIGITDTRTVAGNVFGSLEMSIKVINYMIMIVMLLVTVLMLYLLIDSLIKKEKRNLGVYKALGYTTRQITLLMVLTFLPIIIIASIIGVVCSYFLTNPMVVLMLTQMGIGRVNFTINPFIIILVIVAFNVVAFGISYLVASKVKKLNPYSLIVE